MLKVYIYLLFLHDNSINFGCDEEQKRFFPEGSQISFINIYILHHKRNKKKKIAF